jgi:hypothetical protein
MYELEGRLTGRTPSQRMSRMAETYSSKLAGITLPDPEGNTTRLGSLWESGPAVLVFLRHYG